MKPSPKKKPPKKSMARKIRFGETFIISESLLILRGVNYKSHG